MTNEEAESIRLIRLLMSLTPRLSGKVAARAHHSPATAAFFRRLAPFFATDQVVGGPLLVATVVALICTNSSLVQAYEAFWDNDLAISLGALRTAHPLADWVNDALLPLFFLIIGAEVKREFTKGALSTIRTAAFSLAGAIGGIVLPIAVYLAFTYGTEVANGWGTVITSDTAFALAIIGLFATRMPTSVRAVLLAFAAIDDVGGLLVIAVAYTDALDRCHCGLCRDVRRTQVTAGIAHSLRPARAGRVGWDLCVRHSRHYRRGYVGTAVADALAIVRVSLRRPRSGTDRPVPGGRAGCPAGRRR